MSSEPPQGCGAWDEWEEPMVLSAQLAAVCRQQIGHPASASTFAKCGILIAALPGSLETILRTTEIIHIAFAMLPIPPAK